MAYSRDELTRIMITAHKTIREVKSQIFKPDASRAERISDALQEPTEAAVVEDSQSDSDASIEAVETAKFPKHERLSRDELQLCVCVQTMLDWVCIFNCIWFFPFTICFTNHPAQGDRTSKSKGWPCWRSHLQSLNCWWSGKDGSTDTTDKRWATQWADELNDKWYQDNAGQATQAQDGEWDISQSKLRHGWLNKFAVVMQAMDDNEWHLVKRYMDKLLGDIQSIV